MRQVSESMANGKLPYEAVKKLRTLVGAELENPSIVSDVPRSKWKAVYAALSDDLKNAATPLDPKPGAHTTARMLTTTPDRAESTRLPASLTEWRAGGHLQRRNIRHEGWRDHLARSHAEPQAGRAESSCIDNRSTARKIYAGTAERRGRSVQYVIVPDQLEQAQPASEVESVRAIWHRLREQHGCRSEDGIKRPLRIQGICQSIRNSYVCRRADGHGNLSSDHCSLAIRSPLAQSLAVRQQRTSPQG